jgi:5-methylcytosine-specific restriction endonuclease McrA
MSTPKFFTWLRSQLRRISMKWRPRSEAKNAARRAYKGPNKRRKYEYQCAACQEWFAGKDVQVDHILPCGTLKSYDDLPDFVERLFCDKEGFRVLCKECHQKVTNKNRRST